MLRTLARTFWHRAPRVRPDILIFTLAGDGASDARDAYFGGLADWLGLQEVLTVFLSAGAGLRLPHGPKRAPLEAYAAAADVFDAWDDAPAFGPGLGMRDPAQRALAHRLAADEVATGEVFMQAFMRRAFRRLLARTQPRVLVFPFENRSWEKALVAEARAAGVARVVGYQHSSITPRHLAFEMSADAASGTLPDRVITVGTVTAQWLAQKALPLAERIRPGASLRRGTGEIALPAAHGLLVAISSSRDEALALMERVHAAAPGLALPIVFRSHPTIPAADLFARFQWPSHVRLSSGTTLDQDLAAATLVAYSSSTVALEGMLHGRLPLYIDIGDLPEADPLIGACPAKTEAGDAASIVAAVGALCALGEAELEGRCSAARAYAAEYLRAPAEQAIAAVTAEILGGEAGPMTLSAVIPTKNRPEDLQVAVRSVLAQDRPPDELVVIDQSPDEIGRRGVEALLAGSRISLNYVHDPSIRGLVHAKQVAAGLAKGDIVCFLEDDEVLEPAYCAEIERGFRDRPGMMGCCGLVTNLPPLPAGYVALFHLFHRGMFHDPRVGVHGRPGGRDLPLIPSDYLSGGMSCWRRQVLKRIPFDVDNGFHMLEDVDYSTRAAREFGHSFFINPNARLEHRMSPANREVLGPRERRKLREYLLFYKKRASRPWALLQLAWLLKGLLLESLWQSLRSRSAGPLFGYFAGIADGLRWTLKGGPR